MTLLVVSAPLVRGDQAQSAVTLVTGGGYGRRLREGLCDSLRTLARYVRHGGDLYDLTRRLGGRRPFRTCLVPGLRG